MLRFRDDPVGQFPTSLVKTTIEYRISEEHACSVFGADEGVRLNDQLRLIRLSAEDPRWQSLAELYRRHGRKGFYGWEIERQYSTAEIDAAGLHLLQVKAGIVPTGEECGTVYDDSEMCPLCGCGRVQTSPLRLRISRLPGRAEIGQSWAGEIIISTRLVRLLIDSGITGFGLGPVQRSKKGQEEPFSFSQTNSGRQLLKLAGDSHINYPSPEFFVWVNGLDRRHLLHGAVKEHESMKLHGRRSAGGTSSEWYQLFVLSNPAELGLQTRIGNGPFDDDVEGRQRCPLRLRDHLLGLSLLSQASIPSSQWDGSDFVRSRGFVGVRRGLLTPRALVFISARVRKLLAQNLVKGWTSEPVDLTERNLES